MGAARASGLGSQSLVVVVVVVGLVLWLLFVDWWLIWIGRRVVGGRGRWQQDGSVVGGHSGVRMREGIRSVWKPQGHWMVVHSPSLSLSFFWNVVETLYQGPMVENV